MSPLTVDFVEASRAQRLRREAELEAQRQQRSAQERLIEARHLAAQAIRYATKRPDLAALLSLEALARMENPADQIDLFSSFYLEPRLQSFLYRGARSINGVTCGGEGAYLVMIDDQAVAFRLDLDSDEAPRRFEMPGLAAVSFSSDGVYVSLAFAHRTPRVECGYREAYAHLAHRQSNQTSLFRRGWPPSLCGTSGHGCHL